MIKHDLYDLQSDYSELFPNSTPLKFDLKIFQNFRSNLKVVVEFGHIFETIFQSNFRDPLF